MSTLHHGMSERDYRALPGLSGTGVAKLLDNPADYRYDLDHPEPPSASMSLGTLVHALVLGTDLPCVVTDYADFRTKAAQAWKAEQEALGLAVIKADEMAHAEAMRDAVLAHPVARQLLEADGESEVSVTSEHRGAPLKGRVDRLAANGLVIDLKTARDIGDASLERSLGDYGYACQFAHYASLVGSDLRPVVIAVRNERRPAVAVRRIGEPTWDVARRAVVEAWNRYADCTESGVWPDLTGDAITDINMRPWALDALDRQISGMEVPA